MKWLVRYNLNNEYYVRRFLTYDECYAWIKEATWLEILATHVQVMEEIGDTFYIRYTWKRAR